MVSPDEFEELPSSVQKKYFTSAERLHITQRSAAQKRKKRFCNQTWLSGPASTDLTIRPATATVLDVPRATSPLDRLRRARSAQLLSAEGTVSNSQALWFLNLPDKVRRQHFSREEQATLFARCKAVLEPAAPALDESEPLPPSQILASEAARYSPLLSTQSNEKASSNTTADPEMRFLKLYTRKRASIAGASVPVTAAPPIPTAPPPPPPVPVARLKRKSFNRTLSLTPLALPPPTLAPIPSLPSPETTLNFALSSRLSRPYFDSIEFPENKSPPTHFHNEPVELPGDFPSSPPPDTSPERVSDSESLETLRQSLPSSDHTDEAVDFHFPFEGPTSPSPSSATTESFPLQRPESLDSCDDADDASFETHGPRTPTALPEHGHVVVSHSASIDSGIGMPVKISSDDVQLAQQSSRSSSGLSHYREIETKAPLTRPALRGSEDQMYSWERSRTHSDMVGQDLLALETLAVCDDATGAHGAFAASSSSSSSSSSNLEAKGLKRMWKSIRRQ